MTIAVIGGSGFVGSRLIEVLQPNHKIKNLDRVESQFYPEITAICDIRDSASLVGHLEGVDLVVLLAAEHRDDVSPVSRYYETNVEGTANVLSAMDRCGVKQIVFTSSVAVYGLNRVCPNEQSSVDPFNHYGKSKYQAEEVLRAWQHKDALSRVLKIVRPTVIFGERNRGNVYNLLRQMAYGPFVMIGSGANYKSMSYVGNIVNFLCFLIEKVDSSYLLSNYVDKDDLTTRDLVKIVFSSLGVKKKYLTVPYWIGLSGGLAFDFIAFVTRKKMSISRIRVQKFCATTQFESIVLPKIGFTPPYSLQGGLQRTLEYEFKGHDASDTRVFYSE